MFSWSSNPSSQTQRLQKKCKAALSREIATACNQEPRVIFKSPLSEIRAEVSNNGGLDLRTHRVYLRDSDYKIGWVIDCQALKCMCCKSKFSFFLRRHHCRQCGHVVCNNCSKNRFVLRGLKEKGGSRVCAECVSNALDTVNWDWTKGPLERTTTLPLSFSPDKKEKEILLSNSANRINNKKYNVPQSADQININNNEEDEEEEEDILETTRNPQPAVVLPNMNQALNDMQAHVDRLMLGNAKEQSCDQSRISRLSPVGVDSTIDTVETNTTINTNMNKTPDISNVVNNSNLSKSGNRTNELLLSEGGLWENESTTDISPCVQPSDPCLQSAPNSINSMAPDSTQTFSNHPNAAFLKVASQNGVWEENSIEISPVVEKRTLLNDF